MILEDASRPGFLQCFECKSEAPVLEKKLSAAPIPAEHSLPYLGQTPPGNTALIFAEGIVSKGNAHGQLVISPDGKELFWTTFILTPEGGIARIMSMLDRRLNSASSYRPISSSRSKSPRRFDRSACAGVAHSTQTRIAAGIFNAAKG